MQDEMDDWEPVRVQRPAGVAEWGESWSDRPDAAQVEKHIPYERITPESIAERKRVAAEKFARDSELREQLVKKKQGWLQWMGLKASSVLEQGEGRRRSPRDHVLS